MSSSLKLALAALSISAFTPAAFADKPQEISVRVSYADLDMANPAHAAKLLNRIEFAARWICASGIPHSPSFERMTLKCRQETIARAVDNLGFESLRAAWNGKYAATVLAAR